MSLPAATCRHELECDLQSKTMADSAFRSFMYGWAASIWSIFSLCSESGKIFRRASLSSLVSAGDLCAGMGTLCCILGRFGSTGKRGCWGSQWLGGVPWIRAGGWWLVLAAWEPGTLKLGSNMPTFGKALSRGCISLWTERVWWVGLEKMRKLSKMTCCWPGGCAAPRPLRASCPQTGPRGWRLYHPRLVTTVSESSSRATPPSQTYSYENGPQPTAGSKPEFLLRTPILCGGPGWKGLEKGTPLGRGSHFQFLQSPPLPHHQSGQGAGAHTYMFSGHVCVCEKGICLIKQLPRWLGLAAKKWGWLNTFPNFKS